MASPAPALPESLTRALDEYRIAIIRVCNDLADDDRDPDQFDASCRKEITARIALDAALLELVRDAQGVRIMQMTGHGAWLDATTGKWVSAAGRKFTSAGEAIAALEHLRASKTTP